MKLGNEVKAACAVNAVVVGAAFSSGREAASFFACAGWASWIAVTVSAVLFGALMGMICRFAVDTGARNLPGIYYIKLDTRCGDTISVVYALLMLMMGAVALSTSGELGMLSLGGSHPQILSSALALCMAIILACGGMRSLSALGLFAAPAYILFFTALAIDPRQARAGAYIENISMDLRGNVPVAVLLGMLLAFLKAAMTAGVAAVRSRGLNPKKFGVSCAALFLATSCALNWALQRAGAHVWNLNLPVVVLAARWGVAGYYICILVMWIGCVSVLSSAIGSLMSMFSARLNRPAAMLITASGITIMSAVGLRGLVSVGYPMLGWISALCLGALALFIEKRKMLPAGKAS